MSFRNAGEGISGDDIVGELVRNMRKGKFKIGSTVFVPSIYNVYLHPEAYSLLDGIRDDVTELARSALTQKLARMNRSTIFRHVFRQIEYKVPHAWVVHFEPDHAGTLGVREIMVSSVFGGPEPTKYGGGATTIRIIRTGSGSAGAAPSAGAPSTTGTTAKAGIVPAASHWARIQYREGGTRRLFSAVEQEIRVGRGGVSPEVHLLLRATEISSLHLVLTYRPASGNAFVTDRSMNGTWLNGVKLQKDVEEKLPAKCEIALAQMAVVLYVEIL